MSARNSGVKYLVVIGKSTTRPLLLSQVQSPGNGASLVVTSALISGGAGAAAEAGAAAACVFVVTGLLEVPLTAVFSAARSALASRTAFSSDSSCSIRAFISVSSLIIASLSGGAATAAEGFEAAFALGGVVALSGVVLWAIHTSCMASTQIAAPNTMTILKLFFIGVCSPRRQASPG